MNYPWRTRSDSRERGIALLLAMIIILMLSGLAVSLVLLTDSQVRLGQTAQAQGRVFYAALAGLEEARGRMNGSAPDTITPSLPTSVSQVLYIVNSSSSDPVQPTNPTSPYYDSEYSYEFPGGFASASVLPNINSDQPGAGTSTAIPYKWVRITLMTEASAHTGHQSGRSPQQHDADLLGRDAADPFLRRRHAGLCPYCLGGGFDQGHEDFADGGGRSSGRRNRLHTPGSARFWQVQQQLPVTPRWSAAFKRSGECHRQRQRQ